MQLLDVTKLSAEERAAWRKWNRERWEAVESVKAQELAAMTDERAWEIIHMLVAFEPVFRKDPNSSGLVVQQALFARLRRA